MKRRASITLAVAAVLAAAAPAEARFRECADGSGNRCGSVKVPLDYSGRVPGSVRLHVERTPAPGRGALLTLAGGPGQSAIAAFEESYIATLAPALRRRDLIVFDQRGTGRSGHLRCPLMERVIGRAQFEREAEAGEACARDLGRRRAFYTTRDSVEDIERVRRAVGVRKLAIYGVSYGTKVALAYAMKYPNRVERLVLDSIVEPEGQDPLFRDTFRAMPRGLRAVCRDGLCDGITPDPVADVASVVSQLDSGNLRAPVYDARGRPETRELNRFDLFLLVFTGDIEPLLRPMTISALRSAARGDPAPLLRLENPDVAGRMARPPPAESSGLFAATICEESPFPWDRTAAPADRPAQAATAVDRIPEEELYPFNRATVLETEYLRICSRWPHSPSAPALEGSLPDVPTLLLSGEDDLRTPYEEARRLHSRLPRSTLVEVESTGHAVIVGAVPCVTRAMTRFWAGRQVASQTCTKPRPHRPPPVVPTSLDEVAPAPGTADLPGRTAGAVGLTLSDVAYVATLIGPAGGLRGGRFGYDIDTGALNLRRVVAIPGVEVTGRLRTASNGRLAGSVTVSGPAAAAGTLRLARGGRVTGTLGGQTIDTRLDVRSPRG